MKDRWARFEIGLRLLVGAFVCGVAGLIGIITDDSLSLEESIWDSLPPLTQISGVGALLCGAAMIAVLLWPESD